MTRKEFLAFGAFAVATVFGVVGLIKTLASHAATPTAKLEPEDGTLAAGATEVVDSGASGGGAVKFGAPTPPATGMMYTDANPAWLPKSGENIKTFMRPAGVAVVNAWDFTTSRDIVVVLNTIQAARSAPCYVQLDGGRYFMNNLKNMAPQNIAGNWVGFQNVKSAGGGQVISGLIGDSTGTGTDGLPKLMTEIVFDANMINGSANQVTSQGVTPRDYVLNAPVTAPVPVAGFYFSGNNSTVPMFISGIHFIGQLQTPFGVYSANAQTKFKRNQGVSAPLAWNGFSLWRTRPGSRFQFCKFSGVGFTLNSAPPFETCAVGTNYCEIDAYNIEIDGRTSAEFDPLRRRAGGGWMLNKSVDERVTNMSMHHTRRSGFAFNTNTGSTTEKVHVLNNEFTNISNFGAEDTWPSDVPADFSTPAGFNNYNVEGFAGQYWIENAHQNSAHGHISYAGTPALLTTRPALFVKNARSDDTGYNGMFRISVQGTTTDMYVKLKADFDLYTNTWFDIRRADGVRLTPVKASQYNASLHTPNTHYLMRSF